MRKFDELVDEVIGPTAVMLVLATLVGLLLLWFLATRIVLTLIRY